MFSSSDTNLPANSERFIVAFASIEKSLNQITRRPRYIPFRLNARISARYNTVVKNHLEDICNFAELRNAIVHVRDGNSEIIAEPSDQITEDIERIAALLLKDQNIMSFASSPVLTGRTDEQFRDIMERMAQNNVGYIPIYDGTVFVGILTLPLLLRHLVGDRDEHVPVSSLLQELRRDNVIFLSQESVVQAVVECFEEYMAVHQEAPTILVTASGSVDEPPMGIITLFDLVRIVTYLT